eukprot:g65761.t1
MVSGCEKGNEPKSQKSAPVSTPVSLLCDIQYFLNKVRYFSTLQGETADAKSMEGFFCTISIDRFMGCCGRFLLGDQDDTPGTKMETIVPPPQEKLPHKQLM